MRHLRHRTVLLAIVLAALVPLPATAGPVAGTFGPGPLVGTVGPGWFGTSNTDLLLNLPVNSGTAGARVVGDRLLVTDQNGLTVYDIADPELPLPLGFVPIPQQYYFTEEDVPSNGRIALVGQFGDLTPSIQLNVVDVSLEGPLGQPRVIGTLPRVDEHTFECARDCTYAYGSAGVIIDLTDPTQPRDIGQWDDAVRAQQDPVTGAPYTFQASTHDVTEVAPGILLTSSNPMYLLDVRTTPEAPEVIGVATFADRRFVHANLWPYHGDLPEDPADPAAEGWEPDWDAFDRHVLVGGETAPLPTACGPKDGAFMTVPWTVDPVADDPDADEISPFVRMTHDPASGQGAEYRPEPGTFTDGGSPYSQYCTHWFTTRPDFTDGGLVAIGWYEFGTRFLEVAADGAIEERGWLIPAGGSTSAAYWVNEGTLLTADYQRGVDVLAFDATVDPEDVREVTVPGLRFARAALPRPQVLTDWYTGFGCPLPT
ncbi:hypothetical protein BH23ACT9_BH23ACT9_33310 [soil metagenome]